MSMLQQDPGAPIVLKPLQIDVCVQLWLIDALREQIASQPRPPPPKKKKDCECSKVNSEMFPSKTCLGPKKKLLAVDPEEAASTRVGAVEYFMVNTVFLPNRSTNEEQLKSKPSNSQQGRHAEAVSFCMKSGFGSSTPPRLGDQRKNLSDRVAFSGFCGEDYMQYFEDFLIDHHHDVNSIHV